MKTKKALIGGLIGAAVAVLTEIYLLNVCTTDISCILTNAVLLYPGVFVVDLIGKGTMPLVNIITNILFYFAIGYGIGYYLDKKK